MAGPQSVIDYNYSHHDDVELRWRGAPVVEVLLESKQVLSSHYVGPEGAGEVILIH